jgi:uncharacterized protein YpmB
MKKIIIMFAVAIVLIIFTGLSIYNSSSKSTDFENTVMDENLEYEYDSMEVVYLDGFKYTPSSWISYGIYKDSHEYLRDKKIGEITLDLKDKFFMDVPPDFSGTYSLGSKIYSIEGLKTEYAILVVEDSKERIMYLTGKYNNKDSVPFDLTLHALSEMISSKARIESIEFRDDYNGAWVSDLYNKTLNELIYQEIMPQRIMNRNELEIPPYSADRMPINIIFEDGAKLHIQVYPSSGYALIFGGYVSVSDLFIESLELAIEESHISPTIMDLIPYDQNSVKYLRVEDKIADRDFSWKLNNFPDGGLYMLLNYYRVQSISDDDLEPIVSIEIGQSKTDKIVFELYDNHTLGINGERYEVLRGEFTYNEMYKFIDDYLY